MRPRRRTKRDGESKGGPGGDAQGVRYREKHASLADESGGNFCSVPLKICFWGRSVGRSARSNRNVRSGT